MHYTSHELPPHRMNDATQPLAQPSARKLDDGDFLHAMGRRVRESRERRGMSRRALAEAAEISERYLAQLEAGEGNASVVLLRRVAAALGMSLIELVGENESPVEQRLIRRFFEGLPAHRLEDVILQLMRDFGKKEAARKNRIALV